MSEYLDLLMFAALIGCILVGFPVAFSVAGIAAVFALLGATAGAMDLSLLGSLGQRVFGILTNDVLIAIPIFVLMGVILEKSRIAELLLESMGKLFGGLRGGLGVSVILVGALLAASTGIVGATVIAMGLIALPTMLRCGYNAPLAAGTVCTAGTLGQIIPPSTLLIILADVMSNAWQQAQFAQGKFTVETISVGQLFAGALLPGLALVAVYMAYMLVRAALRPGDAPPVREKDAPLRWKSAIGGVAPPILLIIAVLGAILGGIATPAEAASVGAGGAVFLAGHRIGVPTRYTLVGTGAFLLLAILAEAAPVRLQRSDIGPAEVLLGAFLAVLAAVGFVTMIRSLFGLWRGGVLLPALTSTMTVTAMIFATILAASMFSLVFVGLGGEARIGRIIGAMPGGPTGALVFTMALIFVLGFFLDFVEITVIVLPLVAPLLMLMGHDPMWLSILIAVNLQTSFLTPPFGFSLFYLRGAAPSEVTTGQIYAGVAPYILLHVVAIAILWLIPAISIWLPSALF